MPTTVTASDGTVYHLWQLPDLTTPEPSESWKFTEYSNDLSDGYRSRRLVGADTGVKSWKLKAPTLAGLSVLPNTVTSIDNALVARLDYIRSLYAESKVSGTPFVYTSPINGQYYLVEFTGDDLTLDRVKATVQLYSTGIELKQVRIAGKTVFNPALISNLWGWYYGALNTGVWIPHTGAVNLTSSGDVIETTYNDLPILRLNSVASTGRLSAPASTNLNTYHVFMAVKAREATFSSQCGFWTDNEAATADYNLIGLNAQANMAMAGNFYVKNGVSYTAPPLPGPMNTWAILHVQNTTGAQQLGRPQIGQRDSGTGGPAKIDVGEVLVFNNLISQMDVREITEYLTVKWAIV
jgi:hypothetical protein